jgi:hypothetical protein
MQNDLNLSILPMLAGEHVDLEPSRRAFTETTGDFRAKFAAAIEARIEQLMIPEVFIDIPEGQVPGRGVSRRPRDLRVVVRR